MQVLNSLWFNPGATSSCVGIVRAKTPQGEIKTFIGVGAGYDENADTKTVADWGATFPEAAGNALFGATAEPAPPADQVSLDEFVKRANQEILLFAKEWKKRANRDPLLPSTFSMNEWRRAYAEISNKG